MDNLKVLKKLLQSQRNSVRFGAAIIAPLIGAVGSIAGGLLSSAPEAPAAVEPTPEPPEPISTADTVKEAKTGAEAAGVKKKALTGLRINRTSIGTSTSSGSGLNV